MISDYLINNIAELNHGVKELKIVVFATKSMKIFPITCLLGKWSGFRIQFVYLSRIQALQEQDNFIWYLGLSEMESTYCFFIDQFMQREFYEDGGYEVVSLKSSLALIMASRRSDTTMSRERLLLDTFIQMWLIRK